MVPTTPSHCAETDLTADSEEGERTSRMAWLGPALNLITARPRSGCTCRMEGLLVCGWLYLCHLALVIPGKLLWSQAADASH